ncbi:MAG TPA: glycosyl hydrolase 115 family protein [Candidatus Aquilonibacter sp.]|nr:glycosyl hydrolase 115 family protein [Candidatus Aquilonibacter sp.]
MGLAVLAQATGGVGAQGGRGVVVNGRTAIVLSADAKGPVRLAAEDLASDMQKVFGVKPRIDASVGDASGSAIVVSEAEGARPAESFAIRVAEDGGKRVVRLEGADMRGEIYAIYEFSQEFLGVDPMYYWTDNEPAKRSEVVLAAGTDKEFPAPVFKYRGWFPNDEDLLTGWAPDEKTGIAPAVWEKIDETILRLKGNIVVPGTWNFPDEQEMRIAGERGLILTQHHAMPLGVNVARWPKDVPYNYSTHPEILERAWTDAVAVVPKDQEVLWSVGLRGLSDVSYASMDPSVVGNDKRLGMLISKAIDEQMKIVRARFPDAHFVTDLWQEGSRLEQEGYLKIPPEVTLVWADTGYGDPQDNGLVSAGQGIYFHVAMMNGHANQLTEMVPVETIYEQLGRYQKAGATAYFLVNTSDERPVVMTTRAVMDAVWEGADKKTPDEFYKEWITEEFGAKAVPALTEFYKAYFAAPALVQPFHLPPGMANRLGAPPPPEEKIHFTRWYGDQLYHTEGRELMLQTILQTPIVSVPSQAPKWELPRYLTRYGGADWTDTTAKREIVACGEAQPRWDAVWKMAVADESVVSASRRNFYNMAVLTMAATNRDSNQMLLDVSHAVEDLKAGDKTKAEGEAQSAVAAMNHLLTTRKSAEYGKWKNWYRGDWLSGVYRTQQTAEIFAKWIDDPMTPVPPAMDWGWEAYYHILHHEDDRSVDVR